MYSYIHVYAGHLTSTLFNPTLDTGTSNCMVDANNMAFPGTAV
jgi:hypothetical protein